MGRLTFVCIAQRQNARPETFEVRERGIEAVLGDQRRLAHVALAPHVPLAEVARRVAGLLQATGQRRGLRIEPLGHATLVISGPIRQKRSDSPAERILARGAARCATGNKWAS